MDLGEFFWLKHIYEVSISQDLTAHFYKGLSNAVAIMDLAIAKRIKNPR